jgi:MoxR-like ATPase
MSDLTSARQTARLLENAVGTVVRGQESALRNILACLAAGGHALVEDVPGTGKTTLAKAIARAVSGAVFKRVQFTPDLLPGDITGNPVLQEIDGRREFVFQPGPLFTNIVLADEINRASPKTQSALLEAMQERRVTVLGKTHDLPKPFFVLATQNPIELEGTYPLPEAQLDRFLFKLEVTRNDVATLQRIVSHRELGTDPQVDPVMSEETLGTLLELVRRIYLPDVVANYIARIVDASHPGQSAASRGIRYGASPRAALALASGAKARALMQERTNASFEDVKAIAPAVLRHRIVLDYNARVEGHTTNDIVRALLEEVPFQAAATPKVLVAAVSNRQA